MIFVWGYKGKKNLKFYIIINYYVKVKTKLRHLQTNKD